MVKQERPLKKKIFNKKKKFNLDCIYPENFYQQFSKKNNLNYRFANNCSAFCLVFYELNLLQKVLLTFFYLIQKN